MVEEWGVQVWEACIRLSTIRYLVEEEAKVDSTLKLLRALDTIPLDQVMDRSEVAAEGLRIPLVDLEVVISFRS